MADLEHAHSISDDWQQIGLPTVSVVVAFRRSEHCVLECLRSIFEMDYPLVKLEVIAIDDALDDDIAGEIRKKFPLVRILRNTQSLGCDGAKQMGMDAATGDLIAFTDADCTVPVWWARSIAKNLMNGADIVTGPVRHDKDFVRELIAVSDFRDFQSDRLTWINSFPGCNFAVRSRDMNGVIYNRSGDIRGGSDRLLSWQLYTGGRRIRYDPTMSVRHAPAVSLSSLLERRMMYGRTAMGMRILDPTLPGGAIARMGPLSAPAYIVYKLGKDTFRLIRMACQRLINPWHAPLLLPLLILFRLMDAVGVLSVSCRKKR